MPSRTARRRVVDIDAEADEVPDEIVENLYSLGMAAGGANVIMQLARLPIGRGVAESRVESGRVDRHPIKRLRTTTAFLAVAMLGTREDRLGLRREIDRAHAHVHSLPGDPVAYDAFDPDLQLWVAACLYKGFEDVLEVVHGERPPRSTIDVLYRHSQRLATTLQVPAESWPVDRDAFEDYWRDGMKQIEMDDVTREHLQGIAELSFVVAPLGRVGAPLEPILAPIGRFMTLGWLPVEIRDELGLSWTDAQARWHRRLFHALGQVQSKLPPVLRRFPFDLYLYDTRRRLRGHGRVV